MSSHHNSTDHPLELPAQTFDAIEKAHQATRRARHTVEVSFAPASAGAALGLVGLATFMLSSKAALPDWVKEPLAWSAMLLSWIGIFLPWWFLWTWYRWGRRGGRQSPLGDNLTTLGGRERFGLLAICLASMLFGHFAFQAMRAQMSGAIYFGMVMWIVRLAVLAAVAFCLRRFVRSGFWEYLAFVAAIAGTWGLIAALVPPRAEGISPWFACASAVSTLVTLAAAASLIARWRRWTRANQAAAAIDEATGSEAV